MYAEIVRVLSGTYLAATEKPLATYIVGINTYIVHAASNINNIVGYPCFRVSNYAADKTRFDNSFLVTLEDPKAGSATLLSELGAAVWG